MTQFTSHLHLTLPSVMTLIMTALLGPTLLPLLEVLAKRGLEPHAHAPCYDCEFYNIMQHDQGFHDRQVILSLHTNGLYYLFWSAKKRNSILD